MPPRGEAGQLPGLSAKLLGEDAHVVPLSKLPSVRVPLGPGAEFVQNFTNNV